VPEALRILLRDEDESVRDVAVASLARLCGGNPFSRRAAPSSAMIKEAVPLLIEALADPRLRAERSSNAIMALGVCPRNILPSLPTAVGFWGVSEYCFASA
jgi:HEAT repeat protein